MQTHDTAIKVRTYPQEFHPLLKLINRARACDEIMQHISEREAEHISEWLDDFQDLALLHATRESN